MEQEILDAQERLLKKREELKAMDNHTLSTLKDEESISDIIKQLKAKHDEYFSGSVARVKPHHMTDWEWEQETKFVFEDDIYNEKRLIHHLKDYVGVPLKYHNSSLDNFYDNPKIVTMCKSLIESDCSILITGPTGCGKTHLAVSILREIMKIRIKKYPMLRNEYGKIFAEPGIFPDGGALFTTIPRLLMDLRSVFSGKETIEIEHGWSSRVKTETDSIEEYTRKELLILDDLGAEKTTDYSVTSLYMIIDERINNLKRTIVTTNLSLQELEQNMDARIASRLSGMKIIKITMPDYRKKR